MTITQQHLADQAELEKLKKENETMRQIASADGFYEYFFKQIPEHANRIEAFNHVNTLYKKYFGENKYSNYLSFKRVVNRKLNNR